MYNLLHIYIYIYFFFFFFFFFFFYLLIFFYHTCQARAIPQMIETQNSRKIKLVLESRRFLCIQFEGSTFMEKFITSPSI